MKYFQRRANTAGLLITGAANVGPYGNAFGYGLSANSDEQIPGLRRLADAMKSKGDKAILQIFHPGRQAKYSYQDEGVAYGPSTQQFDFLDYPGDLTKQSHLIRSITLLNNLEKLKVFK